MTRIYTTDNNGNKTGLLCTEIDTQIDKSSGKIVGTITSTIRPHVIDTLINMDNHKVKSMSIAHWSDTIEVSELVLVDYVIRADLRDFAYIDMCWAGNYINSGSRDKVDTKIEDVFTWDDMSIHLGGIKGRVSSCEIWTDCGNNSKITLEFNELYNTDDFIRDFDGGRFEAVFDNGDRTFGVHIEDVEISTVNLNRSGFDEVISVTLAGGRVKIVR